MATDPKVMTGADEGDLPDEKDELNIVETDDKGKPIEDKRVSADTQEDDRDEGKDERRRETHQERRERHRRARERDQREMNFLRIHNQKLEEKIDNLARATISNQSQTIDERLSEALNEAETAEKIMAAAISANNGDDAVKAARLRDDARGRAISLNNQREQIKRAQSQPQPTLPTYLPMAQKFGQENDWFTWDTSNEDSKTVLEIDNEVAKDGYNPNTPAYWQELDRRVKDKLPHRYGKQNNGGNEDDFDDSDEPERPPGKRGPPVGTGRTYAPSSTRREAFISPERKAAMVEAGVWDDPVLRKKYAKAYSEWDRNNSARR
jgi:hypothetical protein